jgi:hypothetical protein
MITRIRRWRPDPYWILLTGLSLFALVPLLSPGYFYSAHDGRHSVFFVAMFDEAIRDGALWPVWAMHHNQGYGYPTFLIQAPLAFYVAEIFVLLGMGITAGVKAAWAVAFLFSAWGMYGLVRRWALTWPGLAETPVERASQAGLMAGLLYVYAPYHLVDIYVRAALAETMLLGWLPWTFWAFDRFIAGLGRPGWQTRLALAGLSYGLLLLTHAFAVMAVTPLLAVFILFRLWAQWRRDRDHQPGLRAGAWAGMRHVVVAGSGGVAGGLLAAIFLLPLLAEGPLLSQEDWVTDTYEYSRHWVHGSQFLSPFWGYGYSDDPVGAMDGMGFQLGLILALLGILALWMLLARQWLRRDLPLFLLLSTGVVLYLMSPAAGWLWDGIPLLAVMQFPWRLLTLTTFTLSALGGLTLWQIQGGQSRQGGGEGALWLMAGLILFASAAYVRPASMQPVEAWREDGRAVFEFESQHLDMLGYTNLVTERYTQSPMTPQYAAGEISPDQLARLGILSGEGEVLRHYSGGHRFGGEVRMITGGRVQIRLYDFPGWQVRVNGERVAHQLSPPYGLMEVELPPGQHTIDVVMGSTPVRTAGMALSGLTLLALAGLAWAGRRLEE